MRTRTAVVGCSALGLACLMPALRPLAVAVARDADEADADAGAKAQDPVANMISLPFENNLDLGAPDGIQLVTLELRAVDSGIG